MGLLSLLPANLTTVETWITRLFLLLALITIGPWIAVLVYDLIFYLARTATHEIPVVGGRARGKMRPRALSLTERPSGRPRRFSLARRPDDAAQPTAGQRPEALDVRRRRTQDGGDRGPAAG